MFFQVIVLTVLEISWSSKSMLTMPFLLQRYVEITCTVTLKSFIPPLAYNLLLVVICATMGFLTRKLPDNFNDSHYIFVSISTTLFMWSVFLPTYFTTFHSQHKSALLSVCLLLNSYITMLCQFGPKVYAVFFVNEERFSIKNIGTTSTSIAVQPANGAGET